jgi:hypothetical protein
MATRKNFPSKVTKRRRSALERLKASLNGADQDKSKRVHQEIETLEKRIAESGVYTV